MWRFTHGYAGAPENYTSRYNVAGKVTFAATNATIHRTGEAFLNNATHNGASFIPCYSFYLNDENTYALNVTGEWNYYGSSAEPGSIFVTGSNIIISPFAAQMEKASAARILEIVFADDMDESTRIFMSAGQRDDKKLKVYNLVGQLMGTFTHEELTSPDRKLPAGVYVINGKKMQLR